MSKLDRILRQHAGFVLILLVLIATWMMTLGGLLSNDAVPFGDGERYALRALSLYGFLHTGQWGRFWDELTLPCQNLFPPHYLVFFLVPSGLASVAIYGVIQALVSCALLALGIFYLCEVLGRKEWSPALFLLCVMQNLTLDSSYFYFADTPFLAVVALSLAAQVRAWSRPGWRASLLSGMGVALPFWVKPANALITLGIYVLAELAWVIFNRINRQKPYPYLRHWAIALAGFLPLTAAAFACGGFQSIVYLIDANETSGTYTSHIECTGLLRLLYFPLCLTAFYQTALLLLIVFVAAVIMKIRPPTAPSASPVPFPGHLVIPLLLANGAFGLFFSFGMVDKVIRGLLMLLPVFWLGIFWIWDRWQVRSSLLFLAAAAYSLCAYAQVAFGWFDGSTFTTSDYQLRDDWLSRFPPMHATSPAGASMTQGLLSFIRQAVPEGGKIAVGTEQMFLTSESLTWLEERDSALLGKPPFYDFNNFLTNQGKYSRPALIGSRGILLILNPAFQYSPQVQTASASLAKFAYEQWMLRDHSAQVIPLMAGKGVLFGVLIVPKEPLTDQLITQALAGTGGTELIDTLNFSDSQLRRLSFRESWEILLRWKAKRLNQ